MRLSTFVSLSLLACATLCAGLAGGGVLAQDAGDAPKPSSKPAEAPKTEAPTPSPTRSPEDLVKHINTTLEAKWKEKGLVPSAAADDFEWFRRVSLDLIGRAPSLDEAVEFGELDAKTRRAKTIDRLMQSDEYARHFARFWSSALISTGGQEIRFGLRQLNNYLYESVKSNLRYDQMTRELLTATGEVNAADPRAASAGGYLVAFRNEVSNLTGNVSRAFLGVEIQCVQCHDDKIGERWNQIDFQQLAAVFNTTTSNRKVNNREDAGYNTWVINDRRYQKPDPRALRRLQERVRDNPMAAERLLIAAREPKALAVDTPFTGKTGEDLRKAFASWVTSPDNIRFSRTVVNRMWAHFMKRGFVEPVDDFSSINEPSMPELLDHLAKDFAATGFDLQRLTRIIISTRAYQLSSRLARTATNRDDNIYYSRAYIAQLSAEQLFDSLIATTGLDRSARRRGDARGIGIIREALLRQFRFVIDDDEGKEKETFSGTVPQALLMMNSEFVNNAIGANPGGTLSEILRSRESIADRVKGMYLAALTREPTIPELRRIEDHIKSEGGVTAAYEDVFWALVNSAEYLNNH